MNTHWRNARYAASIYSVSYICSDDDNTLALYIYILLLQSKSSGIPNEDINKMCVCGVRNSIRTIGNVHSISLA